jgi:hypothetical protein
LAKSWRAASKPLRVGREGLEGRVIACAGRLGHGVGHAGEQPLLGRGEGLAALAPEVGQGLHLFERVHVRAPSGIRL